MRSDSGEEGWAAGLEGLGLLEQATWSLPKEQKYKLYSDSARV